MVFTSRRAYLLPCGSAFFYRLHFFCRCHPSSSHSRRRSEGNRKPILLWMSGSAAACLPTLDRHSLGYRVQRDLGMTFNLVWFVFIQE